MWYNGDYRAVIRYESYPILGSFDDELGWFNRVHRAMHKMYANGLLSDLSAGSSTSPVISERATTEVAIVTVVVLQKKIQAEDLTAWHTFSVGYAFCQFRDQFNKKEGRKIAFKRALKQVPNGDHRNALSIIQFNKITYPEFCAGQIRQAKEIERQERNKARKKQ
jgi:hypothetical protein